MPNYVHAKRRRWSELQGNVYSIVCGGTGLRQSRPDPVVTCPDCIRIMRSEDRSWSPDARVESRRQVELKRAKKQRRYDVNESNPTGSDVQRMLRDEREGRRIPRSVLTQRDAAGNKRTVTCGVATGDGTPCQRPVRPDGNCGVARHDSQRKPLNVVQRRYLASPRRRGRS